MKTTITSLLFLFFAIALNGQSNDQNDYTALRDIYLTSDGDNWDDNTGWPDEATFTTDAIVPAGTNMDDWYGITSVANRITEIDLSDNNLSGDVSEAFALLSELTTVDMSNNDLTGCLTEEVFGIYCDITFSLLTNPQLAHQGDLDAMCGVSTDQVGATCDDGNALSNDDEIQADCTCMGVIDPCDHDLEAPTFSCSDKTVALTQSSQEFLVINLASNLDDNCDPDPIVEGRVFDANNGPEDNWSTSIFFSCTDIPTATIEIRATDAAGNPTICEMEITIQEGIDPVLTEVLSDVTIGCGYQYDLNEFGTYVYDEADREEILITEGAIETSFGFDGLVGDICPGGVTSTSASFLDDCGIGYIERYFVITDIKGGEVLDTQVINIVLTDVFNVEEDIVWPVMYVYSGCQGTAPLPGESGEPEVLRTGCSMLSVPNYTDMEFTHPGGGCNKIVRKWTILDWCIYDSDTQAGVYNHEQIIKIEDDVDPWFTGTTCDPYIGDVYSSTCDLNVTLSAEGDDNCTTIGNTHFSYELDIDADGTIDETATGSDYSGTLAVGSHSIKWILNDYCGNNVSCVKDIIIRDGNAPSLTCIEGLVITINRMIDEQGNAANIAMLDAHNLIKESSDACSEDSQIVFSFSEDILDTQAIYDCSDIGIQTVNIYATDINGNSDFCTTEVTIQDNGPWCPMQDGMVTIGGNLVTERGVAISEAIVRLQAPEAHTIGTSDEEGSYVFEEVAMHDDYEVNVSYDMSVREGVSVVDLVKIQRHILGLEILDTPYKVVAADVDGSRSITPLDLLEIRKVLLNIQSDFSAGVAWTFLDKAAIMADPMNPWPVENKLTYTDLSTNIWNGDFIGVKLGDVNESMDGLLLDDSSIRNKALPLSYEVHDGSRAEIFMDKDIELYGIQFTIPLEDNSRIFQITSQILDVNSDNYSINDNYVTFMWYSSEPISVEEGQVLLAVNGKGINSLEINSRVTKAEIYDNVFEKFDIGLKAKYEKDGMHLTQNSPNPFLNHTTVELTLPNEGMVQLKISDQNGRSIQEKEEFYKEGTHAIEIGEGLDDYSGILLFQATMDTKVEIIKMIKIK